MDQTLPLKHVREQLSDLVSRVAYGDKKVVITKFGKPIAALINFEDYEKLMNSTGFMVMDKARENTKKYPQKELEQAISHTIKEVRKSKRVQSRT